MTFRQITSRLITDLQTSAGFLKVKRDDIAFLKLGEMPGKAPAIYVFAEPDNQKEIVNTSLKKSFGKMTIFACTTNRDYVEAMLDSLELAERVVAVLEREGWNYQLKIGFDSVYSNISVSTIEFSFKYDFRST